MIFRAPKLVFFFTVSSTPLCTTTSWECVFPFKHEENWYNGCAQPSWQDALYGSQPWCPTVTDSKGSYEGFKPFISECRPHCQVVSGLVHNIKDGACFHFGFTGIERSLGRLDHHASGRHCHASSSYHNKQ